MRRMATPRGALGAALAITFTFALGLGSGGCSDDDDTDPCEDVADACDTETSTRCGGSGVQTCRPNADSCLVWTDTETCLQGFVCVDAACVCDNACADGDSQCAGDVVQRCEQGQMGCWQWADDVDCTDTGLFCDDTTDAQCVSGPECGNDEVEGNEVCDGTDLDGETCVTQGFEAGSLDCNGTCDGLDTTGCYNSTAEICDNNQDDDLNGDTDCADTACIGHSSCVLGYNFDFEDWSASNPPMRYEATPATGTTYLESTTTVNSGTSACQCHWTITGDADLDHQLALPVTAGTEYTFHAWIQDNDPTGRTRPAMVWVGVSDDYGFTYSTDSTLWNELTITAVAPTGAASMIPRLRFYDETGFDPAVGATIYTDDWAVTEHHTFTADPNLDADTTQAASDGGAGFVNVGINDEGVLYLATQAGVSGTSDRAVYVWAGGVGTGTVPAPWSKAGVVDAPSVAGYLLAFLDEGDSNHCSWWVWEITMNDWYELTTDVDCYDSFSDPTNLLTGWLNAPGMLLINPSELPTHLWVASVEYGTNNGDGVLTQMPQAVTADDNITAAEAVSLHRALLLSGKIHP